MPNASGHIDCRALFNARPGIAKDAKTGPLQDKQHLIGFVVLMDRNARAYRDLLCTQGHVV